MIQLLDKKNCCGCCACVDACSNNAIVLKEDNEGFWYPQIDNSNCIECGSCNNVCPMTNQTPVTASIFDSPQIFAAYHKNIVIRFNSTSGGIFSALANTMYRKNGYVSGAAFQSDFSVRHHISNNKKDLINLRGSKYLQSSACGLYAEVKKLLLMGEKVLSCGSPCQMAALRTFLGKDHEQLITVDFLCRAANSPKVFRRYLESLEAKYGSKIVSVKSKNKEKGWRSLTRKIVFENGAVYYGEGNNDLYRRGYFQNAYERPSCYECRFKGIPRKSDISFGDFWGIEKIAPSMDGNLGTSLVMLNTEKGATFFNEIRNKIIYKECVLKDVLPGNRHAILGSKLTTTVDRETFFAELDKVPFENLANKHFPIQTNGRLSFKQKIKNVKNLIMSLKLHGICWISWVYINLLRKNTISHIGRGGMLIPLPYSALDIHKDARLILNGCLRIGVKRNRKSKMETRLLVEQGAVLEVDGDNSIKNGSDIQIFKNACLKVGAGGMNMGLQIVCAEKIEIGEDTRIGRDVWIRDNNGGHKVIQNGYTNSAPVIIGTHVWICSNVHILKGVTVGDGAIIVADSVVTDNVPPRTMVAGNPASVVAENVIWLP